MRLLNVSDRFKKLSFLQRIETRSLIITFASKIRSCSWCKRYHLTKSFFYFIYSLLKHAVQRIRFEIFICDSRSRRQSSRTHLIFRVIRDFDDESRRKCSLFVFINALSKTFYSVDLKILLLELETIFNKMSFLITIEAAFIVFRVIARFIRNSLKQTNDIIATIFVTELISLFCAFFRIFSATVESSAQIEIAFIQKILIVVNLVFLIVFKELRIFYALRQRRKCIACR